MDEVSKIEGKKVLGFFSLVMINVIAVDSLRSLPIGAEYGFSLVFFYLIAGIIFFIPSIFVTAELATGWPNTGGIYVWVREAFGTKAGFFVIWFQWVYNVIWYPTIMAFVAATIAYFFNPSLADDKVYMLSMMMVLFWGATIINCFGMKASSFLSTLGAIFGTLVPMIFIISLSLLWISSGKPLQTTLSWHAILPNMGNFQNLAFLSAVIFGLIGMEMSAVHAGEVKNPHKAYPRALFVSGSIIFISLILASISIAIVVPRAKISLVTGLLQAFTIFFDSYHLRWMVPVIAGLIIIGSISGVAAWIIGPSKGILVAAEDGRLPSFLAKKNNKNVPINILMLQGLIYTILCIVFLLMPSINSSYWILSAMTAQLALIVYIILFISAISLRYKQPDVRRRVQVPGGKIGMITIASIGILGCIAAIIIGFLPPQQINFGSVTKYELILVLGILMFCLPPFLFLKRKPKEIIPIEDDMTVVSS